MGSGLFIFTRGSENKISHAFPYASICSEFALKMIYHTVCIDGNRLLI